MYDHIQAALDRTEWHLNNCEAGAARVREAQAADAAQATGGYTVRVREVAGPEQGRALGDTLFGRTVPVRETVHPLGKVLTGPHSHGSVRHTHDRLPGDHLHCMYCGGDSRLCLDNPHHATGPTPVRESASRAEGRRLGDGLFDFDWAAPGRSPRVEDYAALEAAERQARAKRLASGGQSTGDAALLRAWDRACGGSRP